MEFVNLTPQSLTIVTPAHWEDSSAPRLTVPPSGEVAWVQVQEGPFLPPEDGTPFAWIRRVGPPSYGEVVGLPPPGEEGKIYLVSILVLQALAGKGRTDVYAPDTSPSGAVRDPDGRIVGTLGLVRAA